MFLLCYSYQSLATNTGFSGDIGFSVMNFNYEEFKENGQLFNREDGIVPGIKIGMQKNFKQNFILTTFSYHLNDVNYQGETQAGKQIKTRTDEKIYNLAFQFGHQFKKTYHIFPQLYAGLGYFQWQRDIRSTTTTFGLAETYQWWYAIFGTKGILSLSDKAKLSINFGLTYPINPTIEVDFNDIFTAKKFGLAERWGKMFTLAWQYQYTDTLDIIIEPYLEHWNFNQSARQALMRNGKLVGSFVEPQSKMRNYGLMIYLRQTF